VDKPLPETVASQENFHRAREQNRRTGPDGSAEYAVALSAIRADTSERVMVVNARSPLLAATLYRGRANTQC